MIARACAHLRRNTRARRPAHISPGLWCASLLLVLPCLSNAAIAHIITHTVTHSPKHPPQVQIPPGLIENTCVGQGRALHKQTYAARPKCRYAHMHAQRTRRTSASTHIHIHVLAFAHIARPAYDTRAGTRAWQAQIYASTAPLPTVSKDKTRHADLLAGWWRM